METGKIRSVPKLGHFTRRSGYSQQTIVPHFVCKNGVTGMRVLVSQPIQAVKLIIVQLASEKVGLLRQRLTNRTRERDVVQNEDSNSARCDKRRKYAR